MNEFECDSVDIGTRDDTKDPSNASNTNLEISSLGFILYEIFCFVCEVSKWDLKLSKKCIVFRDRSARILLVFFTSLKRSRYSFAVTCELA